MEVVGIEIALGLQQEDGGTMVVQCERVVAIGLVNVLFCNSTKLQSYHV
jgi:hypothetical protein